MTFLPQQMLQPFLDANQAHNNFMTTSHKTPLHISQRDEGDYITRHEPGAHVQLLPRKQEEAYRVMQIIQNQKVHYLKQAIFELQKQNAGLVRELNRRIEEETDQSKVKPKETTVHAQNYLEQLKQLVENLLVSETQTIQQSYPDVEQLIEKVKQLEEEVSQQKQVAEQQEKQVKCLLNSKMLLREKFHKKLKSEKTKVSTEMQALLLEAKAKHLLREANQGTERAKQLEVYFSAFHEKFQNLLLSTQARNSQSRHDDLQRISELEMKLTRSLAAL